LFERAVAGLAGPADVKLTTGATADPEFAVSAGGCVVVAAGAVTVCVAVVRVLTVRVGTGAGAGLGRVDAVWVVRDTVRVLTVAVFGGASADGGTTLLSLGAGVAVAPSGTTGCGSTLTGGGVVVVTGSVG
jgi:hypothetical protein